eukprot:1920322-Pyramimonas_sp.AAC.1
MPIGLEHERVGLAASGFAGGVGQEVLGASSGHLSQARGAIPSLMLGPRTLEEHRTDRDSAMLFRMQTGTPKVELGVPVAPRAPSGQSCRASH